MRVLILAGVPLSPVTTEILHPCSDGTSGDGVASRTFVTSRVDFKASRATSGKEMPLTRMVIEFETQPAVFVFMDVRGNTPEKFNPQFIEIHIFETVKYLRYAWKFYANVVDFIRVFVAANVAGTVLENLLPVVTTATGSYVG